MTDDEAAALARIQARHDDFAARYSPGPDWEPFNQTHQDRGYLLALLARVQGEREAPPERVPGKHPGGCGCDWHRWLEAREVLKVADEALDFAYGALRDAVANMLDVPAGYAVIRMVMDARRCITGLSAPPATRREEG